MSSDYQYDVALSFAGEQRNYVEKVAEYLKLNEVRVFYDKFEDTELWGKDLYTHLDDVYRNKAQYCVAFLSADYARKLWTNHERTSAQARAFEENEEYILPVRFDDTEIPGIRPTLGYLDVSSMSPEDLGVRVIEKLGVDTRPSPKPGSAQVPQPSRSGYRPHIKKEFTDLDRNRFVRQAYEETKSGFATGCADLQSANDEVVAELIEVTAERFTCEVYVGGASRARCQVWLASSGGGAPEIRYQEGQLDSSGNSYNDSLSLVGGSNVLALSALGSVFHGGPSDIDPSSLSTEGAANYLWYRFANRLE